MTQSSEIEIASYKTGPARLVTASSYLIDRFTPDCEIVALPAKKVAGGRLRFARETFRSEAPVPRGRIKRCLPCLRTSRQGTRSIKGRVFFDFRLRDPENWSHFINNHLPLFFAMSEALGLDWADAVLVLPADMPGYLRAAADLFGIEVMATDDVVEGEGIRFSSEPWTAVRAIRADWARLPRAAAAIDRVVREAAQHGPPLPARAFISRRTTRGIRNSPEVEAWLSDRGFETVYPEDLSAADQMRLFRQADEIVAIHGAALAPLLYRPPEGRLKRLVEILPVGHMTDVYRVMAEQVGCGWIGVRGRIEPAHVAPAYRFDRAFRSFSLDDFEVDIASLARAFALSEQEVSRNV